MRLIKFRKARKKKGERPGYYKIRKIQAPTYADCSREYLLSVQHVAWLQEIHPGVHALFTSGDAPTFEPMVPLDYLTDPGYSLAFMRLMGSAQTTYQGKILLCEGCWYNQGELELAKAYIDKANDRLREHKHPKTKDRFIRNLVRSDKADAAVLAYQFENSRITYTYPEILRPFTDWCAGMIEKRLNENDHKPPWEHMSKMALLRNLMGEMHELSQELVGIVTTPHPNKVMHECFDVAVSALMLASKYDEEMSKLKRGRHDTDEVLPDGSEPSKLGGC